jgi:two-component system response regulator HydG
MTRRTPKEPPGDRRDALKARIAELLAEMKKDLGENDARAAFFECAAEGFPAATAPAAEHGARARAGLRFEYARIVGQSPALLAVLRTLDRIVDSELPVLITGESGTGKELIARAIHENGNRAGRAFVRENCAAIPESLLESELFGYRRGAFTGALQDKKGLFEEGDGGCVFLDEIGEMSLNMQAKLMRVLQEGEIRPVGASATIHVDVRLISATNQDLRRLVAEGRFREDLFFRLNVVPIELPPLRERVEDIPILVETFLRRAAERAGRPPKKLEPDALDCLVHHRWPGNIRELENEISRAFALSGPAIRMADLSPEVTGRESAPFGASKRSAAKPG